MAARWRLAASLCLASCLFDAQAPAANETDFVEALRARGLDRLAELRCRERLADEGLPPRAAAGFAIQLSLIEVDRALAAREGQETHWSRARDALRASTSGRESADAWLLLSLQQGLNRATRGEFQQAVGDPAAVATLRDASRLLASTKRKIEDALRAGGRELSGRQVSARELEALASRGDLAQARVERLLALCHPAGSADRDDALLQALQLATDVAGRNLSAELVWRARLLVVSSERLLGAAPRGLERLNASGWRTPPAPPGMAGAVAAERWRLLGAIGRDAEASRVLFGQAAAGDSPELAVARIESLAQEWSAASGDARDSLSARVQQALVDLRTCHGGLWAVRGERVAGEALASVAASGSVEGLAASADYLYRTGRRREAVEAYDRAAGRAFQEGATGRSYELARTAAAIVNAMGDSTDAAERFRRAALASPTRPDAAATHRLAILTAADAMKAAGAETTDSSRINSESPEASTYARLLAEHRATWPDAQTADEVGWWQTKWWAASGQSARAAAMLADINPDDSRYEEAIRLLGAVYLRLKEEVGNDPEARRRLLAEATARLQPVVTGAGNRWPAAWSDLQRRTAIVLAELHGGAYAQRLLTAAIDGKPAQSNGGKPAQSNDGAPTPSGDGWRDTAVTRLTLVLVDAGDADAARRRLGRTPIGNSDAARRLLQSLESRLASRNRLAAGEVMLDVIRSSPAGPEQGRWKAPYAAAAYTALGQPDKAIQLYEPLVEQRPDDIRLQLNFAESLTASERVDSLQRAISIYATIEQRTPKASGSWWDARIGRLRALAAAGEREKATKLLRITRVLYPQLGGRSDEFAVIEASLTTATQR